MKGRNSANKYSEVVQAEVEAACRENREIELSKADFKKLHPRRSPVKAMRAMCLDCMGGQVSWVKMCTSVGCPLWPFRMGKNPFHTRKTTK